MNAHRILTLIGKELRELRANPGTLLPAAVLVIPSTLLPFLVLHLIPRLTGEKLADDEDIRRLVALTQTLQPSFAGLSVEAAAQAFMLQQLMFLFLIGPIIAAVSLAAYSVVGEKQARTLEPLLTTPLTTGELLIAKTVAAYIPALVAAAIGVALFFAIVILLGQPGVAGALLTVRTAVLFGLVGPLAALAALQSAIAVSSRVNDPRSAQQVAAVVAVPLAGVLIGQLTGVFFLGTGLLLLAALGLLAIWAVLAVLSVALFQRETILTRWK